MKTICCVTSTRAEFGIIKNLLIKIDKCKALDLDIVATGMHLSSEFGYTYREIIENGLKIDEKIETLLSADSRSAMTKCMALTLLSFSEYFQRKQPDVLLVTGDRFEMFAVCIAAYNQGIPIAHIHGGEITEGAIDDAVRHAVTKLSYWHFTTNAEHRKRVIQMGEHPKRVYNVGSLGVENIYNNEYLSKDDLEESLDYKLGDKYFIVTFHPETIRTECAKEQINNLFRALDEFPLYKAVFTKANSDAEGRLINSEIETYVLANKSRAKVVESLGNQKYLSAVKYCSAVIGNSSSGIIEVPSLHVPTVNIGDRQKGRSCAESVIHCAARKAEIVVAIQKALSQEFSDVVKEVNNPYGKGNSSDEIISILINEMKNDNKRVKHFYDINFEV